MEKSKIYFSANVDVERKEEICGILGFQSTNAFGKYLGFPIVRVLFSLAHRPKDPGPNSCILVDWAWFTAAKWGLITNQVVRKSHKSPQGKNAIPPKQ